MNIEDASCICFKLKKSESLRDPEYFGAEGGTRTRTGLLPHGPEPCASTNSTTSANPNCIGR